MEYKKYFSLLRVEGLLSVAFLKEARFFYLRAFIDLQVTCRSKIYWGCCYLEILYFPKAF
jgi:hypothetical protein